MAIRKAKTDRQLYNERFGIKPVDNRPGSTQRGYGIRWQIERKRFLEACGEKCAHCGGRAIVVDHIVPHKGDMTVFWDRRNWQALCKPCHDSKTAREDGGFGREKRHG